MSIVLCYMNPGAIFIELTSVSSCKFNNRYWKYSGFNVPSVEESTANSASLKPARAFETVKLNTGLSSNPRSFFRPLELGCLGWAPRVSVTVSYQSLSSIIFVNFWTEVPRLLFILINLNALIL